MEEELLKELDSILKPAIDQAWMSAHKAARGGDPRTQFMEFFKTEIDNTNVDLSKTLYKMDMAMQGYSTDVERAEAEFAPIEAPQLPEINTSDYIKEVPEGYEVWDGIQWVKLSKEAHLQLEVFENPERNNRPAVKVWARDEGLRTSVVFIDNDLHAPGWDLGYTFTGDEFDIDPNFVHREVYWENPFYSSAKISAGLGGRTAGALSLRHVGNMTPWRTGSAFRNSEGWYRNAEGIIENLNKQRGVGAGGYQKSAKRALGKAKIFKGAGKIFFFAGVGFSAFQGIHAYTTNDSNQNEVYTKATVDIAIAIIGVAGGPVGWLISGTYFVLDVSGAFGDWGLASGISKSQHEQNLLSNIRSNYGEDIQSLQFEIDYAKPMEAEQKEMYLEERTIKKDNTAVSLPRTLYRKN